MTSVYNQLYDNGAYTRMAKAIADHMGVNYDSQSEEYLVIMMIVVDYGLLKLAHLPPDIADILYHKKVYPYYIDFVENCAYYYRNKKNQ